MIECQICSQPFETDKSLHTHLKKHGIYQAEYYCKYYPRTSIYYKKRIPFINKKDYFNTEFIDINEFLAWEKNENSDLVKKKCLELISKRVKEKEYLFAPFHNELETLNLPPINILKKYFGTYGEFCKLLNLEPLFNRPIPKDFYKDVEDTAMLIDTREQQPIPYENQSVEKLYIGDYLLKNLYTNTFVDRKSESDFLGTLSSGLDRFEKEIQRAVELGGYLFVVTESSIAKIQENHKRYNKKTNLKYVFHNMRYLSHKYPRKIQFLFTSNRSISKDIIPRLLYNGEKLWQVDMQYYIDDLSKSINICRGN
jgi:hypothetical protein